MPRIFKRGVGMFRRSVIQRSEKEIAARRKSRKAAVKKHGFFGAQTAALMDHAQEVLEAAGLTDRDGQLTQRGRDHFPPEDSAEDFALRLRRFSEIIKADISEGRADQAARWAFEMGALHMRAVVKHRWEDHALSGKKAWIGSQNAAEKRREAYDRDAAEMLQSFDENLKRGKSITAATSLVVEALHGEKTPREIENLGRKVYRARKRRPKPSSS